MSVLNNQLEVTTVLQNGYICGKNGGSISLNPYRNYGAECAHLHAAWEKGWNLSQPQKIFLLSKEFISQLIDNPKLRGIYESGATCCNQGMSIHANPYRNDPKEMQWAFDAWEKGWKSAMQSA